MFRRSSLSVAPRFLWECLTSQTVNPFPAPATSHPACGFPALGAPVCLCQELCGLSCWSYFRTWPSNELVVVKQTQPVVKPFATPPLPAEAFAFPGTHQMPPDLLLYPAFDHPKAETRMADPKVVHPATQDRIDFRNHDLDGPTDMLTEDLPELFKQRCPLLQLGCIVGSPRKPGVCRDFLV